MTGDVTMSSTGFLKVPVGNNAQQPGQSGHLQQQQDNLDITLTQII